MTDTTPPRRLWIKQSESYGYLARETEVTDTDPAFWLKDPSNWKDFEKAVEFVEVSAYDALVKSLDNHLGHMERIQSTIGELEIKFSDITKERDEWRSKALDCLNHPAVVALITERDAARSALEQRDKDHAMMLGQSEAQRLRLESQNANYQRILERISSGQKGYYGDDAMLVARDALGY